MFIFDWFLALLGFVLLRRQRARRIVSFDSSTRLPTRAALVVQLERALKQNRPRKATALVLFDFSDLETSYDASRSSERDLLLDLGHLLRSWVPSSYLVGHMRDREFGVLVSDGISLGDVENLADSVVDKLRAAKRIGGRPRSIATFLGFAYTANSRDSASDLLRSADVALSRARTTGRGRYVVVDKLPTHDRNAAA